MGQLLHGCDTTNGITLTRPTGTAPRPDGYREAPKIGTLEHHSYLPVLSPVNNLAIPSNFVCPK